eukprot:gene30471-37691_t
MTDMEVCGETYDALAVHFGENEVSGFSASSVIGTLIPQPTEAILSLLIDDTNSSCLDTTLLYRGSRDGFTGAQFHAKCDGHKEMVVLIRDTLDNVFGVYVDVPWNSVYNAYTPSSKCFMFTLKRGRDTKPVKHKVLPAGIATAFLMHPGYLLYMGSGGGELTVPSSCGAVLNCYSKLAGSFFETHGCSGITTAPTFQVVEFEVYE